MHAIQVSRSLASANESIREASKIASQFRADDSYAEPCLEIHLDYAREAGKSIRCTSEKLSGFGCTAGAKRTQTQYNRELYADITTIPKILQISRCRRNHYKVHIRTERRPCFLRRRADRRSTTDCTWNWHSLRAIFLACGGQQSETWRHYKHHTASGEGAGKIRQNAHCAERQKKASACSAQKNYTSSYRLSQAERRSTDEERVGRRAVSFYKFSHGQASGSTGCVQLNNENKQDAKHVLQTPRPSGNICASSGKSRNASTCRYDEHWAHFLGNNVQLLLWQRRAGDERCARPHLISSCLNPTGDGMYTYEFGCKNYAENKQDLRSLFSYSQHAESQQEKKERNARLHKISLRFNPAFYGLYKIGY